MTRRRSIQVFDGDGRNEKQITAQKKKEQREAEKLRRDKERADMRERARFNKALKKIKIEWVVINGEKKPRTKATISNVPFND